MLERIQGEILNVGISGEFALWLSIAIVAAGIILLAIFSYIIMRHVIVAWLIRVISRSKSKRDDVFTRMKVFSRLSHIAPAAVIYLSGTVIFQPYPVLAAAIERLSLVYLTLMIVLFFDALLSVGLRIYRTYPISRTFPITSFVQVGKLLLYFFGFVAIISLVLGQSPLTFLAGFGALAAVLMFVFKDPILGFVAGIQLSANKMVAVGDWVEMPKYGVDGDIMEIGLTTVKVRNFDKTITTIPTQSLINDSFKNWRGMQETGGRRIKRAIHIDLGSVKFCDEEMLARFAKIEHIAPYIAERSEEIATHNREAGVNKALTVNGRHLTNLGTFRAYVEAYLRAHPRISEEFTFLVRQLKPSEHGVPIEIYVFTNTTNWIEYEAIQADIFDHLLAAVPAFDLTVFQTPTGADFAGALG
ncbi:MAG: mechanosensitive ion channel domain-containing protein [Pseudomonadota bacterium]